MLVWLVLVPGAVMAVLALLRFRFAQTFWRRLYLVGLVYVAVLLARAVYLLVT